MTDTLGELWARARDAHHAGYFDHADSYYRTYLERDPENFKALHNLALIELQRDHKTEALDLLRRAERANPESPEVHNSLGLVLMKDEQYPQAVECFTRCLALAPNAPAVLQNKAMALNMMGHYAQAALVLQQCLAAQPINPEAHNSLAMARWGQGDDSAAITECRGALSFDPNFAQAHHNLGSMLVARGEFKEGWPHMERRTFSVSYDRSLPRWQGTWLKPRQRVLIWGEQGLGDHVLQLTMLPSLSWLSYCWQTDGRLVPLVRRANPGANVVAKPNDEQAKTLTHQIPALSLAQYFRNDPVDFPRQQWRPPVLRADSARVQEMLSALSPLAGGKTIGISWRSPQSKYGHQKSTELAEWIEILGVSGCRFVDLQYGDTRAEREALRRDTGTAPHHLEGIDLADDLEGLAALITACDLVICVSNATAHISAALGVPTWVLVPQGINAFWHWGRAGETTPWYKDVRVIRKDEPLIWSSTLRRVALDLLTFSQHAVDIAAAEPQPIGPNVRSSS